MKLDAKKKLAARVLGVGKSRVVFDPSKLDEIKEAITRADIIDLVKARAIIVRPIKGKKKKKKKRKKRRKMRRKKERGKKEYIRKIRKIRRKLKKLREEGKISTEEYKKLRKKAKAGVAIKI